MLDGAEITTGISDEHRSQRSFLPLAAKAFVLTRRVKNRLKFSGELSMYLWVAIWGARVGKDLREQPPGGMKIEFNASQPLAPRASTQVIEGAAPSAPIESMPLNGMAQLQSKLSDLAPTRPNNMDVARLLVSSVKYPPEALFNGIAHLLANRLTRQFPTTP